MSRACSTHWRDEECIQVSVGKPGGRGHYEDLDLGERIILKRILEK
jgi:hypothetical protein